MTHPSLTPSALAHNINLSPATIRDIVSERRGITADTALKLAQFFKTTPKFWMNLQISYELKLAEQRVRHAI